MTDILGLAVVIVASLGVLGWYVWNSLGASLGEVEVLEKVGDLANWDVCIADVAGRRMVQLVLRGIGDNNKGEVQMFLNASQAGLLSQWVRLAATPGRTLADARRWSRRSG